MTKLHYRQAIYCCSKGYNSKIAKVRVMVLLQQTQMLSFKSISLKMTKLYPGQAENAIKIDNQEEITQRQHKLELWFFFALHSILLQQMPNFKTIRPEMTKLCSGQRTGRGLWDLLYATGDPIICPVFDGRMKINYINKNLLLLICLKLRST